MKLDKLIKEIDYPLYLYCEGELVFVGHKSEEIIPYLNYKVIDYEESSHNLFITIKRK